MTKLELIPDEDFNYGAPAVDNILLKVVGAAYTQRDKRVVKASIQAQLTADQKVLDKRDAEWRAMIKERNDYKEKFEAAADAGMGLTDTNMELENKLATALKRIKELERQR